MADRFIAIAGNIGVGKTTLVEYLTTNFPMRAVYEPYVDNPYLDDFYADMKTWAFQSQIWFLTHKYGLHRQIETASGTFVQDRTIYEDAEIFATYLHRSRRMNKRDFGTFMELYETMRSSLQPPDLMIYLYCPVRTIRRRIRQRGRKSEQDIPSRYLRKLNDLYEGWMSGFAQCPVLTWDTQRMDYLSDLVHRIEFHRSIEPFLSTPVNDGICPASVDGQVPTR